MLTPEQINFQRNYYFWDEDNHLRQKYDNHWCKFYGGPLHNEWQRVDDISLNIHVPYPRNDFTFVEKTTYENIMKDLPKVCVYKPIIKNFTIHGGNCIFDITVDYVYCGVY